jgi:hypothetical protein
MELAARRYLCAGCRAAVLICSHCDRGQRYCSSACADQARRLTLRAASGRYQASPRGRMAHAQRQRRYRAKQQKVTHQGSPPVPAPVSLAAEPAPPRSGPPFWHCWRCHCPLPRWVRLDFLRRRIRRPSPSNRSLYPHEPIP